MSSNLHEIAASSDRPLPRPDVFSEPFWKSCREHVLRLQRCTQCATFRYYPRPACPTCLSRDHTWETCSGNGEVYSFTIVHRALARWFKDELPLVVAVIELDENVRMLSNVVDIDPEDVRIGLPVEVTWDDVTEHITLPKFRPRGT